MNKILNIIEQVEQGKITAEESVKLIKAIVLDIQEDELLDYVFPTKRKEAIDIIEKYNNIKTKL